MFTSCTLMGAAITAALALLPAVAVAEPVSLLNSSYDVSRELYKDINLAFAAVWKNSSGVDVEIKQAHGGQQSRPGPWQKAWRPTSSR